MDTEIREAARNEDHQFVRRMALRRGETLIPLIGDVVEICESRDYKGRIFGKTFFGQPCPVRALIVGYDARKYMFRVVGFPPLRITVDNVARDRKIRVVEVGRDFTEFLNELQLWRQTRAKLGL